MLLPDMEPQHIASRKCAVAFVVFAREGQLLRALATFFIFGYVITGMR
jgi:hypothetical protein